MIKQVYGSVDGVKVIFTPSADGSTWTCQIPRDADGEYVVDLYAVNDLGAVTYFATVLFAVKGVDVTVSWLRLSAQARMRGFTVTAKMSSAKHPAGPSDK